MPSPLDYFQAAATDALDRSGLTVRIKSNLGPPVTVYQAGDKSPPSPLARLLSVGVRIEDGNGRVLQEWGGWPATNQAAVLGLSLVAGLALLLMLRGLR